MKYALILTILLSTWSAWPTRADDPQLAGLFADRGLTGTLVLASLDGRQRFIHNDARAQQRFPCASTFKILNTLIALEEQVVTGKDHRLVWDGQVHDFPDWNRDQTLESAFKVSCVWCYQDLARAIGADKYRHYIHETAYGVLQEPFLATRFWLDGSLQISAIEQVEFLRRLHRHQLPFRPSSYATLREIMLHEDTPDYRLWAKTGWAMQADPPIGWFVGYVAMQGGEVWLFATNLIIRDPDDLPLRQKLVHEALRLKGITVPVRHDSKPRSVLLPQTLGA